MRAIVRDGVGPPSSLRLEDVETPTPGPGEVRLAVRACSLNGSDAEFLAGEPAYARIFERLGGRIRILGSDVAGVVDAVGEGVDRPEVGDRVFADLFERFGCLAEHVCAPAGEFVPIPDALDFLQAAALPQAGVVALQGVRDHLAVQPGDRVLILGAGGSMGTFAVQLAKARGAEVTAVDRASKEATLRRLGADRFIDFEAEDFAEGAGRYDAILDIVGRRSVFDCERALAPGGRYGIVGGFLPHLLGAVLLGPWYRLIRRKRLGIVAWDKNTEDLAEVARLVAEGELEAVVGLRVPLERAAEGFEALARGAALGKVVVEVAQAGTPYS